MLSETNPRNQHWDNFHQFQPSSADHNSSAPQGQPAMRKFLCVRRIKYWMIHEIMISRILVTRSCCGWNIFLHDKDDTKCDPRILRNIRAEIQTTKIIRWNETGNILFEGNLETESSMYRGFFFYNFMTEILASLDYVDVGWLQWKLGHFILK